MFFMKVWERVKKNDLLCSLVFVMKILFVQKMHICDENNFCTENTMIHTLNTLSFELKIIMKL